MEAILEWAPVLWLGRVVALLVLSGAFVLAAGLLLRIVRPASFWALVAADVPVRRIKGKLNLLGQEFEANVDLDSRRDEQLTALASRLESVVDAIDEQGVAIKRLLLEETESAMATANNGKLPDAPVQKHVYALDARSRAGFLARTWQDRNF